jgi:hypothetical protein
MPGSKKVPGRALWYPISLWLMLNPFAPAHGYEPGTWRPPEADRLATDIGGWYNPKATQ